MSVLVQRLGLSSTGNRATWTFSAWVKRSRSLSSANEFIFSSNTERTGGGQYSSIYFQNDCLSYYDYYSSAKQKYLHTNRKFRDVNAWYHIVVRVDTTQSTASDRIRFYVNGVQETSFSSSDYPAVNDNSSFVNWSGADNFVGTQTNNLSAHFLGSMSHVYLCDGQSYAPTVFGSTDSTTGEWKINTSPTITMGTNGFTILKDGNTVTDQSSNSNDFSIASGTLTKTEDNPSNVFATWNPLSPNDSITYSNGNLTVTGSNATNYSMSCSTTLGASSGKYYWEMKYVTAGNGNECIGVANFDRYEYNQNMTSGTTGYVSLRWDGERQINNVSTTYFTPPSTGAILMCAMDMDNGKVFFGSNGVWFGSGNPVTGANPTADILTSGTWGGILRYLSSKWECNFGNGYFGTTAVSSAGTNASGIGIFEYDVPTGYTALSTKGLNL
jgi:hypothetical protein